VYSSDDDSETVSEASESESFDSSDSESDPSGSDPETRKRNTELFQIKKRLRIRKARRSI
jgi:hypothetical protein